MLGDREPASILRLLLWRLHAERGESSSGNGVAYGGVSCTLPEEHEKRSQGRDESDIPCCSRIHTLSLSLSFSLSIRGFYFGWGKFTSAEIKYCRASPG